MNVLDKRSSGKEKERLRGFYLENGIESMSDIEILELFLFYAAPECDTAETAERLLSHFGNDVSKVFAADLEELCTVQGISRNAAALIHLVSDVHSSVRKNENSKIRFLDSTQAQKRYVFNELSNLAYERLIVITLGADDSVISCNTVADGTVNIANIELVKIVKCVLYDNAEALVVAHNHPSGESVPSNADIRFTASLSRLMSDIGAELKNHLIVGSDDVLSMADDTAYRKCFVKADGV